MLLAYTRLCEVFRITQPRLFCVQFIQLQYIKIASQVGRCLLFVAVYSNKLVQSFS